jgi:hypothetical protein
MDVKELNKSQLIMLAILLSFITSIATGIVTVTLMQQAPSSVTVPINRVVRETVEKIVPGAVTNNTQTVVVKEEDLVVDAIAKNQPSIFTITKESTDDSGNAVEVPVGRGLVVSDDGYVAVDATLVPDKEVYYVTNDSGKFKADYVSTPVDAKGNSLGFSFIKIGDPVNGSDKLALAVPTFGDITKMKAGQKIIILGDNINSFIFGGSPDMEIDVTKGDAGGAVLDLDGDVLGIASLSDGNSFIPVSAITDALKTIAAPEETPVPAASTTQ